MLVARGWFESPVQGKIRNVKFNDNMIDWEDSHGSTKIDGKDIIATLYLDKEFNGPGTVFYVTQWSHDIKKPQPKPASSTAIKAKSKNNVQRGTNKKTNGAINITKPT